MESNNKNDIGTNENRYVSYFGSKSNNTKNDAEKNNFDLEIEDLTLEDGKIESDVNGTNETGEFHSKMLLIH